MICSYCNCSNPADARFCWRCGRQQILQHSPPLQAQPQAKPTDELKPSAKIFLGFCGVMFLIGIIRYSTTSHDVEKSAKQPSIARSPQVLPTSSSAASENTEPVVSKEEIEKHIKQGKERYAGIRAKYKMPLGFSFMAEGLSISIPIKEWNKISKYDQVSLSYYAESLLDEVKSSPKKYVDEWKRRVETLELPYDQFVSSVSRLCNQCWEIWTGELVKDNGKYDIIAEQTVVTGKDVIEFRKILAKDIIKSEPTEKPITSSLLLSEGKSFLANGVQAASDEQIIWAYSRLKNIPPSAPEYKEAKQILKQVEPRFMEIGYREIQRLQR